MEYYTVDSLESRKIIFSERLKALSELINQLQTDTCNLVEYFVLNDDIRWEKEDDQNIFTTNSTLLSELLKIIEATEEYSDSQLAPNKKELFNDWQLNIYGTYPQITMTDKLFKLTFYSSYELDIFLKKGKGAESRRNK